MAEQDALEVDAPGGFKVRARGYDILTLIIVVGLVLMSYMFWEHKGEAKASQVEVTKAVEKVAESQAELSYLISLSPEERSRLKLDMPDSLRRRMR